jgi:hypothetical protein
MFLPPRLKLHLQIRIDSSLSIYTGIIPHKSKISVTTASLFSDDFVFPLYNAIAEGLDSLCSAKYGPTSYIYGLLKALQHFHCA